MKKKKKSIKKQFKKYNKLKRLEITQKMKYIQLIKQKFLIKIVMSILNNFRFFFKIDKLNKKNFDFNDFCKIFLSFLEDFIKHYGKQLRYFIY